MKYSVIPDLIGHAPGETYQDVLDRDPRPVPDILREDRPGELGVEPVKASRYTSPDFFKAEVKHVWLKTWQYACREEDIPNVGDTHVFDLIHKSAIIIRQEDGSLKALQNACLHRGRKLVTEAACKSQVRCPYHGLTWNIDGSFRENPIKWDMPQIDEAAFSLPEIRVGSWAGFVFVNFDPAAAPLLDVIGPMQPHLEYWRIQDCYRAAHVAKVAPANWKVCTEAFLEAHHLVTTHPQALAFVACEAGQYDLLSDHVTRFMSATGVTGGLWPGEVPSEETKIKRMFSVGTRAGKDAVALAIPPDATARSFAGDMARQGLTKETGYDFSNACDADVIDGIAYDLFPNFHLWGGFSQKICYRFRPLGTDHEKTLVEIMLFKIAPAGRPKPNPAELHILGDDEPWTKAPELGYLSGIYDQDQSNFGPVQQGLRALEDGDIQFSRYQEMRCRNLHRMIDRYIAAGTARPLAYE